MARDVGAYHYNEQLPRCCRSPAGCCPEFSRLAHEYQRVNKELAKMRRKSLTAGVLAFVLWVLSLSAVAIVATTYVLARHYMQ